MADGFASLTSGLLARKGQARPAMRPQGFAAPTTGLDDLGWNDMGQEAPRPIAVRLPSHLSGSHASMVVPAVVRQQEELAAAVEAAPIEPVVAEPIVTLVAAPEVEPAPPAEAAVPEVEPALAAAAVTEAEPVPAEIAAAEVEPALVIVAPVVVAPVAPIAAPVARRPARKKAEKAAVMPSEGRKAAFTLRLDVDRHLRLRLACALENRSAQQLVIRALDLLLADMPDVDRLAQSLPATTN